MASFFRFSSQKSCEPCPTCEPCPGVIGLSADEPPPAIWPSWDDMFMCETGGSTIIILAIILALYLGLKIHLILRANNAPRPLNRHDMENLPRPLINNHMGNLSTFRTFVRKYMLLIENTFVLPFVPADLPSYVTWIFMWYFAITIPMAVTRYYERKWAHDTITIQGPLNLISYYVFGCKTLNLTAVV
jgi:hypothetical protein